MVWGNENKTGHQFLFLAAKVFVYVSSSLFFSLFSSSLCSAPFLSLLSLPLQTVERKHMLNSRQTLTPGDIFEREDKPKGMRRAEQGQEGRGTWVCAGQ